MKTTTKNKIRKWWKKIRKQLYKAICAFFATLLCVGCGVTKASVKGLAEGTTTTITITTNNPISTQTTPNVELNKK